MIVVPDLPKDTHSRNACPSGKRRYPVEDEAREAVLRARAYYAKHPFVPTKKHPRPPLSYYKCKHCRGFHITSLKPIGGRGLRADRVK